MTRAEGRSTFSFFLPQDCRYGVNLVRRRVTATELGSKAFPVVS